MLRLHMSCLKPARTGVQAERSEFIGQSLESGRSRLY